jgi:hypothetical protein
MMMLNDERDRVSYKGRGQWHQSVMTNDVCIVQGSLEGRLDNTTGTMMAIPVRTMWASSDSVFLGAMQKLHRKKERPEELKLSY